LQWSGSFRHSSRAGQLSQSAIASIVTNVAINQSVISRIELGDNVNVIDYRFMDKTLPWFYVVYPITDGTWKTTNDPVVRASVEGFRTKFIEAHSRPSRLKSPDTLPAPYARGTIVLVLLSGPIIALQVWIRKIVNKNTIKKSEKHYETFD
jgi:hypothetical protein